MKKQSIIGFYGYWVWLTYLSVITSFTGVTFALRGKPVAVPCMGLLLGGAADSADHLLGPMPFLGGGGGNDGCFCKVGGIGVNNRGDKAVVF